MAEKLGCSEELSYVERILENGSGAATQHKIAKDTGDLKQVISKTLDITGKPWEQPASGG